MRIRYKESGRIWGNLEKFEAQKVTHPERYLPASIRSIIRYTRLSILSVCGGIAVKMEESRKSRSACDGQVKARDYKPHMA